jgi:hypothetical protein
MGREIAYIWSIIMYEIFQLLAELLQIFKHLNVWNDDQSSFTDSFAYILKEECN